MERKRKREKAKEKEKGSAQNDWEGKQSKGKIIGNAKLRMIDLEPKTDRKERESPPPIVGVVKCFAVVLADIW